MDLRTLGEQCHDAKMATAKNETIALELRKKASRIYDQVFLMAGGPIEVRKATARLKPEHVLAEDRAMEAETASILAKAEANGLEVRFEEWRTIQATRRAEMQLR